MGRFLFSSRITTVLTMIGVSVGLGNVWRFPYMMGKYGGSAFLFIYLLFALLFAIPALTAEWAFGRETRQGPVGAFSQVWGKTTGRLIGGLLLTTALIADSYYLVVIANVADTTFFSFYHGFDSSSIAAFNKSLNNGLLQYSIAIAILLLSLWVIYRGLNKGIELVSKIFVPFFLVTIIYLIYAALTMDGAVEKALAFLKPDFSLISAEVVFAALGQAFFSLGLGGTFLLLYGSYMRNDQNIPKSALLAGFGDVSAALLAGLFIVPSILVFNLDMTSGPSLIFSTLPQLFATMPAGRWLGSLFLISLTMMAFLSNIAALEVFVGGIADWPGLKLSRNKAILMVGIIEAALILPSALYPPLIGHLDLIFGSGMQTLGSALVILALFWGMSRSTVLQQVFGHGKGTLSTVYYRWMKWVIPAVLLVVLITYIYNSI
ncbi:MAG: sodium-dependent transporter [Bacteroidota bacterium]